MNKIRRTKGSENDQDDPRRGDFLVSGPPRLRVELFCEANLQRTGETLPQSSARVLLVTS